MHRGSALQSLSGLLGRFRVLIGLAVILALGVTALAFMAFTQREVTLNTLSQGDAAARNIMRVIMLNLAEHETGLKFFRSYARKRYEDQLRNLVSVVVSQVDFFHGLYEKGLLSQEQARQSALDAVQNMRYGNNDYFFIYDRSNVAISHADPDIRGRNMSAITDLDGRFIARTMWDMMQKAPEGFLTISWTRLGEKKPVPKLLYFRYYPKWDWLIGTGLYIDDIDRDVELKMTEIIDVLGMTFNQVRIAETGGFTLFDGAGKVLIVPAAETAKGQPLKDPAAGALGLQVLIAASNNPGEPVKHLSDTPEHPGQYRFVKYSHVEHFEPFNWYVSSSVYQDELKKPARRIIWRQAVFVSVVVLLAMIGVYLLVSRVTAPLAKLAWHAAALQKNDFTLSEKANRELLAIRFPSEIGHLARTFWNMEHRLEQYLKDLKETTAAREKMESELRIARDIQMSMLPDLKAALAGRTEINLAAVLEPAREVGGDLYDFFFIDHERFCFMVGDVSDKGVPAALFMARSKALLRSAAQQGVSEPGLILELANKEMSDNNDVLMFITVFLGILNVHTGELAFSNAAHVPPVVMEKNGQCRELELPPGKPMGILKTSSFATRRLNLSAGSSLVVFTDGVTEAESPERGFFGSARLLELLQAAQLPMKAAPCVQAVLQGVHSFCEGAVQSDDIAVLCIGYNGPKQTGGVFTAAISAELPEISGVLDRVDEYAQGLGCPADAVFDLHVALEELLVNTAWHDESGGQAAVGIELEVELHEGALHAAISDSAGPFNPLEVPGADTQQQRADRKIGGLGLHLVRSLVDGLSYERRDDRNIVRITKKI